MFKKTIFTSSFTIISIKNIFFILIFLFNPKNFFKKKGFYKNLFKEKFLDYLGIDKKKSKIITFLNGRSALFHSLKIAGIGEGDFVGVQVFTCVSVINSILQSGAKPFYIEIGDDLNLDLDFLEKNFDKKIKCLIVQNTFGNPCEIKKIKNLCLSKNIFLIEDCAHFLGGEIYQKKAGLFGDFSIFSLGRDKIISTINGGVLIINNEKFFGQIENIEKNKKKLGFFNIIQNINYFFVSFFTFHFYDFFGIGKIFMEISKKIFLIPKIVSNEEKKCNFKDFDFEYPEILAFIGIEEIKNIDYFNSKRIYFAGIYEKKLFFLSKKGLIKFIPNNKFGKNIFLRYSILARNKKERDEIFIFFKKNKIFLGNWYDSIIGPKGSDFGKCFIEENNFLIGKNKSEIIINLPNSPFLKEKDIEKVIFLLEKFFENKI